MPLIYGTAVHACLAAHYNSGTAGQSLAAFEEVWDREMGQVEQETLEEEDGKRNPVRWAKQFMAYRTYYNTEPFTVRNVEVPYFLPLTDDLALSGIIDLAVEYLNQIMLVDHKTTSYLNNKTFKGFNPNCQFSSYLLAANELIQPEKFIGTLLVNCILSHKTEMNPDKMFARVPTTRSPAQLAEQREELIGWWGLVKECRRLGNWPKNDQRCGDYSGCDYHILCTDVQANYRKMKPSSALFKEQAWDPLASIRRHGLDVTV
jgi:hypothetical protein